MSVIALAGTLCAIAYSLFTLWCAVSFRRSIVGAVYDRASHADTQFTPAVSILKPLCGMDPHAYESLRSHCVQDYPAFEIIFGVSDPDDEIVPAVQRLMKEFPAIPMKLVNCTQRLGSNLKISNLIQMIPNARHEFLIINDSDIEVPKDYLQRVIAPLEQTSVGMVTCLYRGIAGRTIGSKLESLGISSDFIPGVLCAKVIDGGIHFGLGSTLAFSRKTLETIGGLQPLADFLADDYQLGYRISQAHLNVEFADCVVDHYLPPYSFSAFFQHQLRWARAIRTSRPGGYVGLIFTFAIPWSLLNVLLMPGAAYTWLCFAAAVFLRYAVWLAVQTRVLRTARVLADFWLLPIRDLIAVIVWIACYGGHHVVWRGKRFALVNGKLRESS
jgi:ceramide glucosyltransferase